MYKDEQILDQYKQVWLTKEVRKLLNKEKGRLWKEEKRKLSIAKLANNAVLKVYGDARLRSEKGVETTNQHE